VSIQDEPYGCKPRCDPAQLMWCTMLECYECIECSLAYSEDEAAALKARALVVEDPPL
jgi:hypothetical protein